MDRSSVAREAQFFQTPEGLLVGTLLVAGIWLVLMLLDRLGGKNIAPFARAIRRPVVFGIGITLYFGFGLHLLSIKMALLTEKDVTKATTCVFLLVLGRALTNVVLRILHSNRFDRWLQRDFQEERDRAMMRSLLEKLCIIVIALLTLGAVMIALGVSATAVGAVLGGAGIGIGFGTQQISQNFLSGLMLFFNRPFTEGDWINVSSFQGVVERIGWYHTRIRTFERRPLYIPNALFATTPIENPGRMYNRRINAEIGLRYEDLGRMPRVIEQVRKMLMQHDAIDQDQLINVNFNQWDASSVNMLVNCFTKTTVGQEWLEIQQDVFFRIAEIVSSAGADFAFPSTTLYPAPVVSNEQGDKPESDEPESDGPNQLLRQASN